MNETALNINGLDIGLLSTHTLPASNHASTPALCVHGWLDNANSFKPLCDALQQRGHRGPIVAVDLPGNGRSAHLGDGAQYQLAEMPFWVLAIADALGWSKFHLLGHSMGAGIAALTTVTAPERIASLCLLEGSGPLTEAETRLPDRLQRAARDRRDPSRLQSRTYPSVEKAVQARLAAARMNPDSARLIVERQLQQVDDGWQWSFDARHRYASPVYLTENQVRACLGAITAPTLALVADAGYLQTRDETDARLACIKGCEVLRVTGHHHTHMDNPELCADAIHAFLQRHGSGNHIGGVSKP